MKTSKNREAKMEKKILTGLIVVGVLLTGATFWFFGVIAYATGETVTVITTSPESGCVTMVSVGQIHPRVNFVLTPITEELRTEYKQRV